MKFKKSVQKIENFKYKNQLFASAENLLANKNRFEESLAFANQAACTALSMHSYSQHLITR